MYSKLEPWSQQRYRTPIRETPQDEVTGAGALSAFLRGEQIWTGGLAFVTVTVTTLLTREMLLRELLAGLGRLADLLPDSFPLVILIVFNSRKQGRFLKNKVSS